MTKHKKKGPGRPKKAKPPSLRKKMEEAHKREALGNEIYKKLQATKRATCRMKVEQTNQSVGETSSTGSSQPAGETSSPKDKNQQKQELRDRYREAVGNERYKAQRAEEQAKHRQKIRKAKQDAPIAAYSGEQLDEIVPISLEYTSLNNAEPCAFCGALLFKEEKSRSKWCCSEGQLYFPKPLPLTAPFYEEAEFLSDVREYNNLFSFSALGVTGSFQKAPFGYGPQMVKIQGKTYHRVFDLNWSEPGRPNNSQLYIDDGRMRQNVAKGRNLNTKIVSEIEQYLKKVNPLTETYKQLGSHPAPDAHIVFERTTRAKDGPILGDRPTAKNEISGLIKTTGGVPTKPSRKVTVWKTNDRQPQFVDILDEVYEPLQYPILFPNASKGWFAGMTGASGRKLSLTKYYRQWLLGRDDRVRKLGRLGQEYMVDGWSRAEEEKLNFIRYNQAKLLRTAKRKEIDETIAGEGGGKAGKIYLPNSHTGSPRNMAVKYQDAMAVVNRKGKPSFFVTITTNPKWKEIQENLLSGQTASDRPDLCDRVFHEKLAIAKRMVKDGSLFGKMITLTDVIEFQKRGLPHAHLALRVAGGGPIDPKDIDRFVRATIPDENEAGGRLRKLVLEHMIHGPCGEGYPRYPCTDNEKKECTKGYPKNFCDHTHIDDRGYVNYKRPEGNTATTNNGKYEIDNRNVVPYCPALLLLLECHCNVEIASSVHIIKYLFKYIHKGPDRAKAAVTDEDESVDEIHDWETFRCITSSEADWRLLEYDISNQYPPVKALPVHLPNEDSIMFEEGKEKEALQNSVSKLDLYLNRPRHPDLDHLTYPDFWEQYSVTAEPPKNARRTVFELHTKRHWCAKRVGEDAVARIHWISPALNELFYLRMLLNRFPANSFTDLLVVNGVRYDTFQESAQARGLLSDEKEYREAILEANVFQTGSGLRQLLVCMIICGAPARLLWDEHKDLFSEDFLDREPDQEEAYNKALCCIDKKLLMHGKSLEDVGLPHAVDNSTEIARELLRWDKATLEEFVEKWIPLLSESQRAVYEHVMEMIEGHKPIVPTFVDGPSGTGKTVLLNVICAKLRSMAKIALPVASTGNAALNYPGGVTAHAMFKIPIDTTDPNAYCDLSAGSQRAQLIAAADLIIWDEAPMSNKHNVETVDRTLQDLCCEGTLFGGKPTVLIGDNKQIPPVVKNGAKMDVLSVSLKLSPLWNQLKVFSLNTPQRDKGDEEYSKFVLKVGEDKVQRVKFDGEELIPLEIVERVNSIEELINFVYDDLQNEEASAKRAILSGTNKNIDELNKQVLSKLPGDEFELLSADSCVIDNKSPDEKFVPTDILHRMTEPGVPDHCIKVKKGAICLIIRNLSFDDGLVNGSKVIIRHATNRIVQADLLRDGLQPIRVSIPRINFVFRPPQSTVTISRRQFPLRVAYCLTFNKCQGQTLDKVGLDLRTDVFAHGQLYVALGRVRNRKSIKVLVSEERVCDNVAFTRNIVYPELL